MKSSWKGAYEYDYPLEGEGAVNFEMQVVFQDGKFVGELTDEEFTTLTGDVCQVEGMLKDNQIQFTQTYPYQYDELEDGTILIDGKASGHQVYYEGTFNSEDNHWEGVWVILPKDEEELEADENLDTGTWFLKRVTVEVNEN